MPRRTPLGVPKLGIDNENAAVCSRNRILAPHRKPETPPTASGSTTQVTSPSRSRPARPGAPSPASAARARAAPPVGKAQLDLRSFSGGCRGSRDASLWCQRVERVAAVCAARASILRCAAASSSNNKDRTPCRWHLYRLARTTTTSATINTMNRNLERKMPPPTAISRSTSTSNQIISQPPRIDAVV